MNSSPKLPTVTKPLELSRERISEHVWLVTLDDGTTQEEISVKGMVLMPKAKNDKRR